MYYPSLSRRSVTREIIDTFAGYNHNLRIPEGEFYDTQNLTTDYYPMLSSGKQYKILNRSFTKLQAIIAKDQLYWVDNGTLYANGYATQLTGLQTEQETRLVSMGAYICVFPDKKYINTMDLTDFGSMGASWTFTGTATYTMCHQDGTYYTDVTKGSVEPSNPANGAIWIDTASKTTKEYSVYTESWTVLETVYTRVDFTTNGNVTSAFSEYDGVQISGMIDDDLNGSKIIYALGGDDQHNDWIVIIGIQEEQETQQSATITIERKVPDMDFVCEAQNRLWGCFYGNDGTHNVNEIYCCALGDFRNWEQYLGISTDSWRGSRGSDGPWTGCINYLGTPTFFKETVIHPVRVSPVGAHQIDDIPARGVQQGSHNSLAVVNETLYYKARSGIMAYQGGIPAEVGQALGDYVYSEATAGVFGSKYYISMKRTTGGTWSITYYDTYCFDASRGIWLKEGVYNFVGFAAIGDELYAIRKDVGSVYKLVAMYGTTGTAPTNPTTWIAESGIIYYARPVSGYGAKNVRYISRFNIRVKAASGATMTVKIKYDSSGSWSTVASLSSLPTTGTVTIPVRPRRCDHLQLRLEGTGDVKIYNIAKLLALGSDV